MTQSDVKTPSGAATPAEAVACLREYVSLAHRDQTTFAEDARARAALESLEAEVGRLTREMALEARAHGKAQARIRTLESELAEKTARVAELPLRPALAWFAQAMERKLRANDHKGGWIDGKCDMLFLFEKLTEERRELTRATGERDTPEQILAEAADVANIAMMIADVCQPVARPEGWDQARTPVALDRGEAADLLEAIQYLKPNADSRTLLGWRELDTDMNKDRVSLIFDAAERWAALQWREPSTAPLDERVLFIGRRAGYPAFVCIGERTIENGWIDEDTSNNGGMRIEWANSEVLGWLPLDALPALPSDPVKP